MEPRIAILDPEVVNQIAAGEVVERPASVVKELVENSLDAQARRIDVEVDQGGQQLVRVADDGHGMTPTEARLALQRHATSKLRRTEDLQWIQSMGFRGEALPSIASVSRLTLITRPVAADAGIVVRVEGGHASAPEPAGCREGTTLEVAELFFNTPARRKFLKSTATESAHVADVLTQLALANPHVHLTLAMDGRPTLDFPPAAGRLDRARTVLGRRGAHLFEGELQADGVTVQVCLCPPGESTRSSRSVYLVVNRRAVRDRVLLQALVAGHETLLDPGRFPVAVVHLDLPPQLVDVNVHPQKVEVRFADPGRVGNAIRTCVRETLAGHPEQRAPTDVLHSAYQNGSQHPRAGEVRTQAATYRLLGHDATRGYDQHRSRLGEASRRFWSSLATRSWDVPEGEGVDGVGFFSALRVVGQVLDQHLVCEGEDELVLLDLGAARQRVVCHRLTVALEQGEIPRQLLLIPAQIRLGDEAARLMDEQRELVVRLGFEVEPLGGQGWTIRAVPLWLAGVDPAALVHDLLARLGLTLEPKELLAALARQVTVERQMEPRELAQLLGALDQLDLAEMSSGRPVVARMDRASLARLFGEGRTDEP